VYALILLARYTLREDIRLMIYTFSPNWYKPQCLHFTKKSLYYCSNYLLYHYDLSLKSVTR
jgi:hypothetical protein